MDKKTYTTTVASRPALPRSRYRISVSYTGPSSAPLTGSSGTAGKDGVGIASIETEGASVSGGVNVITISLTDGTAAKFNVRNGYDGASGRSAYEIAVDEGFDGTESEWLESLKGEPGSRGGTGPEGKSAYEVAVKEGFEGDETEWLDSLKGSSGSPGAAAGFGVPTASATAVSSGTAPSVEVTASGPDTAKVFAFAFKIPKGKNGGGSGAEVVELPDYLDLPSRDEDTLYAVVYKGKCDLYLGDIRITNNITAVLPVSILLSGPDSVTGGKNATAAYTASLLPDNVTETGLTWAVFPGSYASINQSGLLTALGRGTVTVVVKSSARPRVTAAKSVSVNLTMKLILTGQGFETSRAASYKYLFVSDEVQSLGLNLISSDFDGAAPANGCTVDSSGVGHVREVISGSPSGDVLFLLSKTADGAQAVEAALIDVSLAQTIVDAWYAVAASVTVNTGGVVALTGLSISGDSTVGNAGNKSQYSVVYTPSNTTQTGVTWSVESGSAYASIDQNGLLKVKSGANGNAVRIRATSKENTSIYAEKTVTVTYVSLSIPVTGVTLNKSSLSLAVGGSETLVATVTPSRATDKSVTWSSSAPGVAEVDQSGKVTAKSAGSAVITVTTNDGGHTASCALAVAASGTKADPTWNLGAAMTLDPSGGTVTVNVSDPDGKGWLVMFSSWMTLQSGAQSGTGDGTLVLAYPANGTGASRDADIVLRGSEAVLTRCTATQAAAAKADPTWNLGASRTFEAGTSGFMPTVTDNDNVGWKLASDAAWITARYNSMLGKWELIWSANTGAERSGTVRLVSTDGSKTFATCVITQAGTSSGTLSVSPTSLSGEFMAVAGTDLGSVTVTTDQQWTAELSGLLQHVAISPSSGTGSAVIKQTEIKGALFSESGTLIITAADGKTATVNVNMKY